MAEKRNLLKELYEPAKPRQGASAFLCSLAKKLDHCCKGAGYTLDADGPFVNARICDCVQSCALCYGKARQLNEDGESAACTSPHPVRQVGLLNEARIPARYKDARIEYFSNLSGNGEKIRSEVTSWCDTFANRKAAGKAKGFVLWGDVGVGKTYMLCGVAFELVKRQYTVRFVDFFQLLMELRGAYSEKGSDASILNPLLAVDVLIIDELGKGRNNDWELSVLDQLVMGRYNRNKIIIASTNYSPLITPEEEPHVGQLDQSPGPLAQVDRKSLEGRVGKRIFSRLKETAVFWKLGGDDFRRTRHMTI